MRVLVTGHNGYVGTVMIPLLVKAGHDVVGYDTNLYQGSTFGAEKITSIPSVNKDIRDISRQDLEGFEAVIHLAGLSNDPLGDLNPALTDEINFRASVRLAKLAKEAGITRFIFSSSCSNYGAGVNDWLDEQSGFNPVTPYGHSKVNVEKEVSQMADDDFSPTFLRSGTAYGVSPRLRFDLVLNNLTAWAFCTGRVFLKSDGTPWRPIVHIEDMSRAFLAALEAPRETVHNEAFNVGRSSENYQIRQLAEIVAAAVPGSRVEYAEGAGPDKRNYRVNCDKIVNTLPNYQPTWTAAKGARELYEAYKDVGLKPDEFEGPRYRRIHHIKMLLSKSRLDQNLRWVAETERV
ncbi:MAG: SDR family oxidoreductase [Ardenticatenaceae bacterium]|nr:SDR family oxidoreductase [Ardenticatenaceae bacterium]